MNAYPYIIEAHRIVGEELAGDIYKHLVWFYHIDDFDLIVVRELSGDATVTTTENQDTFYIWMNSHGDMDHHLVIDELFLIREDDRSIRC